MENMICTTRVVCAWMIILFAGCGDGAPENGGATDDTVASPADSTRAGQASAAIQTMLWLEGSCDFLRRCSSWTQNGVVLMGCDDEPCSDTDPWVAGPSVDSCGETVTICYQGSCVAARVRDISVIGGWEGNLAVFHALKLEFHVPYPGCSGGSGGDQVTIYRGGSASGSNPAPAPPSASTAKSCWYGGEQGTCVDYRSCAGTSHAGLCPGSASIQCCVPAPSPSSAAGASCWAYGKQGTCVDYRACAGTRYTGLCPGSASIQCCVM